MWGVLVINRLPRICSILNLLESGDQVMADRGFDIENEMPPGVGLNIPPFLDGAPQLSLQDEGWILTCFRNCHVFLR